MVKFYVTLILCLVSVCAFTQTDTTCNMVTFIEDAPYFKGDLANFIQANISYPKNARKDSIEGIVVISFWVDTLGVTTNHQIIKSIRKDLNDEALRVAKLVKFEKSAMQRGKPVKVRYTVPVKFKLSEKSKQKKGCKK